MRKTITQGEFNKLVIFQEKSQLLRKELDKIDKDIQKMLGTEDDDGHILDFLENGEDIRKFLANCRIKLK